MTPVEIELIEKYNNQGPERIAEFTVSMLGFVHILTDYDRIFRQAIDPATGAEIWELVPGPQLYTGESK